MNPEVDDYVSKATKWRAEIEQLRTIILDCGLAEGLKWRSPCYMFGPTNIVLIQEFKDYCALLFFKGALLNDTHGLLVGPGENSRVTRQVRFTNVRQIAELKQAVKDYVRQAIEVEQAGLKVARDTEFAIPEELQKRLDQDATLKTAFHALTPGRQRAYALYFSAPKQAGTRESRIDRSVPSILEGRGLNDR